MAPRKHSRVPGAPRAGGYHVKTGCVTCKYVVIPILMTLIFFFEGISYLIVPPPLFHACNPLIL